jgi:hypothetical protein
LQQRLLFVTLYYIEKKTPERTRPFPVEGEKPEMKYRNLLKRITVAAAVAAVCLLVCAASVILVAALRARVKRDGDSSENGNS